MSRADEIRSTIEILQRELAEIEEGVYHVYPGDTQKFADNIRAINVHMEPITYISFQKDRIDFWGGAQCFTLNIVPLDTNSVFTMHIRR